MKDELLLLQVGWEDASLPWLREQLPWSGTSAGCALTGTVCSGGERMLHCYGGKTSESP